MTNYTTEAAKVAKAAAEVAKLTDWELAFRLNYWANRTQKTGVAQRRRVAAAQAEAAKRAGQVTA